MNNKVLYIVIAVLVLLGLGFILYNNRQESPTAEVQTNTSPQVTQEPANAPANSTAPANTAPSGGQFSNEADVSTGSDVQVREVVYNGNSFTPNTLTIKVGDVVSFKNNSTKAFWPASAPHPQHTGYPEFDPKKAIAAGGSWEFKFTKVGTWPYHDHLNATVFGRIIVTP